MIEDIKKVGNPFVFRYRPDNNFTLDEIRNSYVFFQKRELLNDPFDSTPNLIDLKEINFEKLLETFEFIVGKENKELIQQKFSPKELDKTVRESIPNFINKHGIACFSMDTGINMPLLANYSNNYKGVYFQYNIELDTDFFSGLRPMNYEEELKKIPIELSENEQDIFNIFYLKHKNWSNERELRLIKDNVGKYDINRKSLRNIICAFNCSDDYINEILNANKLNEHVSVWLMEKPSKLNNLTLNLIK